MSPRDFKPVVFDEPKPHRLKPLFTGRCADALDSFANLGSLIFWCAYVLAGLGLITYHLYSLVIFLASRNAWLALSAVIIVTLVFAFFFWCSSLFTRLITITVLAITIIATAPFLESVLN